MLLLLLGFALPTESELVTATGLLASAAVLIAVFVRRTRRSRGA